MYDRIGIYGQWTVFYNRSTGIFLSTEKRFEALVTAHNYGASWPEIEQTINASEAEVIRPLWRELDNGARNRTESEFTQRNPADIEWEQSLGNWNNRTPSYGGSDLISIQTRNAKIVIEVSKAVARQLYSALHIFDPQLISESKYTLTNIVIDQLNNGQFRKLVKPTKNYSCPEHIGSFEVIIGYLAKDLAELSIDHSSCAGVLHCATLYKGSTRILICNPSKSGKTTLAWLLHSSGYLLIHDDIFPILKNNHTQQVNTLSITRIGSDEVLKQYGFSNKGKTYFRNNQEVRFRRIDKTRDIIEAKKTIVIFVNFTTNPVETKIVPIEKIECFKRIISEECIITDRSIENLSFLFGWFFSHQYFEVTYSDFRDVPILLDKIVDETL